MLYPFAWAMLDSLGRKRISLPMLSNPQMERSWAFFLECLHTIVRNFVIEADERGIAERSQKTGDPPFVKRLTADGALNDPDTFLI